MVTDRISTSDIDQSRRERIRILLADDHPLMRAALRNALEKESDFKVMAEVGDGEEAVRVAMEFVPDIVIMDITMPRLNGLEATRKIKMTCPMVAILVLTVHNDTEHIMEILEAGASGYLTKSASGNEIICAIRGLIAGETVLAPEIFKQLFEHALRYPLKSRTLDKVETLNTRELQILRLAAHGMSNKEIAQSLDLNVRTVKNYLTDLFSKLRVGSRTEAVIAGLRTGIITLSDLN